MPQRCSRAAATWPAALRDDPRRRRRRYRGHPAGPAPGRRPDQGREDRGDRGPAASRREAHRRVRLLRPARRRGSALPPDGRRQGRHGGGRGRRNHHRAVVHQPRRLRRRPGLPAAPPVRPCRGRRGHRRGPARDALPPGTSHDGRPGRGQAGRSGRGEGLPRLPRAGHHVLDPAALRADVGRRAPRHDRSGALRERAADRGAHGQHPGRGPPRPPGLRRHQASAGGGGGSRAQPWPRHR